VPGVGQRPAGLCHEPGPPGGLVSTVQQRSVLQNQAEYRRAVSCNVKRRACAAASWLRSRCMSTASPQVPSGAALNVGRCCACRWTRCCSGRRRRSCRAIGAPSRRTASCSCATWRTRCRCCSPEVKGLRFSPAPVPAACCTAHCCLPSVCRFGLAHTQGGSEPCQLQGGLRWLP
jgi:hypothetical protein